MRIRPARLPVPAKAPLAGRWTLAVLGLEARDIEQHIAPYVTLSTEFRHQATSGSGRTEDHWIYSSN
jgi:hypothetical protein